MEGGWQMRTPLLILPVKGQIWGQGVKKKLRTSLMEGPYMESFGESILRRKSVPRSSSLQQESENFPMMYIV